MDETNFDFGLVPFNSWAVFATWPHLGALQELQEK
jgi:hypothetical protein